MPTRRIYTVTIPEDTLKNQSDESTSQQQLAKLAGLTGDGSVSTVGSSPGQFRVQGQFRGQEAEMMATELRELAVGDGIESVPFYLVSGNSPDEGYYTLEQTSSRRFRPQSANLADFDVRLVREGTKATQYRAVRTEPRQVDHSFGTDTTVAVGVPNAAVKRRWLSEAEDDYQLVSASPTTHAAEYGDVDEYDYADKPNGYSNAFVAYEVDYAEEGNTDVALFDTMDRGEFDADGNFVWQQVFQSSHDRVGRYSLENGLIRLRIGPEDDFFEVDEWDDGQQKWLRKIAAGAQWVPEDVEIVEPGMCRYRIQIDWEDTNNPGTLFTLDAIVHRGWDEVQFAIPDGESGPIPGALSSLLNVIASPRIYDPREQKTLKRKEVFRR